MKTEFTRYQATNPIKHKTGDFIAFKDVPALVEELETLRRNTTDLVTRNALCETALHKMRECMVAGDTVQAAKVLYKALGDLHKQTEKELFPEG